MALSDIRAALELGRGGDLALLAAIHTAGAHVISRIENVQPKTDLQIASVHFCGIIGFGDTLLAAARDWQRQARREVMQ